LYLNHTREQFIDFIFTIAEISSINEMIVLLAPSSSWCVQFEGPQEIVDLLEDATSGVQLIDHILNTLNIVSLSQFTFNDEIVGDWNTLSCVLNISTLVEELTNSCERWITECLKYQIKIEVNNSTISLIFTYNVRLSDAQHIQ
jgi:hypothetical protein